MLTYSELIELRDKLTSGEIELEFAKAQYWKDFKEGQKSWQTKDWKNRRAEVIKAKCEICHSKEKLTLQHLSHPRNFADYKREVTREYAKNYRDRNPDIDKDEFNAYIQKHYEYRPVAFCPNCNLSNPYERSKKVPKYRCTYCRHEFDSPVYKSIDELLSAFFENEEALEVRDKCFASKDQWRNKQNLSNIKYWLLRERAKNNDAEAIEKKAFLLSINDSIKYLSFEDTITACRKCAYSFDIKKMELCPQCKVNYKGIQYPTCIPCLPEDKRKAALEIIEFGKGWQAMHEELGVD